jgi:predicted nucleic acid-binding Zn ribbon protein
MKGKRGLKRIALLQMAHAKGFCKYCNKMLIQQQVTDPDAEFCSDVCKEAFATEQNSTTI